jgi:hypothetical protein
MIAEVLLHQVAVPDTIYTTSASPYPWWAKLFIDFGPTLVGLIGLASLIVAYLQIRRSFEQTDELLEERQREEERNEIQRKLNEFYGPCQTLMRETKMLHDLFKHDSEFRTLTELLKGREFTGNDKVLLEQVMNVTDKISDLIVDKSGLIEDEEEELQELLSKARVHFRILRLGYNNDLSGDTERLKDFVYPKALDEEIERKKTELENRLNELREIDS